MQQRVNQPNVADLDRARPARVNGAPPMQQGQYMDGGQITSADSEMCFFPIQSLPGGSGSPVFWPSHNGMVSAVFSGLRVVFTPSGPVLHPRENRGVLLTPAKNTWIESM